MKKIIIPIFMTLALTLSGAVQSQEYTSREEVAKDPTVLRDFKVQGEYVEDDDDGPAGMNIIAEGDGKFKVVAFTSGLPGDGWKKGDVRAFGTATFKNNTELEFILNESETNGKREKMNPYSTTVKLEDCRLVEVAKPNEGGPLRVERKSATLGLKAPEGAIVIFDGESEGWLKDGNRNEEAGTMWSEFTSKPLERKPYTLHVEFMLSYMPNARGQARSNSGVYLDESFECQVLDSFGGEGADNECGGIYTVSAPKLNMCYPPLQWQTYDIEFMPPLYDADGKQTAPAKFRSVKLNGVVVQENVERADATVAGKPASGEPRGVYFQGHGNKVQYRNIWVKYDE